jgi:hypothetical protein
MADLPPPPPPGSGQDVDMEIEEGELPGGPPPPPAAGAAAAAGLMPPPPPVAPAGPAGWYGGVGVSAAEEKWRPQKKELSAQTKALLKSMGEEAYGEYFPETGGGLGGDDDEEGDGEGAGKKKKGAAGGDAAAGEGGGGKPGKPGAMTDERRREQKLDGQLGRIKQLFHEKGFGNEAAFKKPEKLEVAATPARKRPRI